jgi:urease accessory protein
VLTVIHVLPPDSKTAVITTLSLTADERKKTRHRFTADDGTPIYLNLPRGSTLVHNTLLTSHEGNSVRVVAKPQPVILVKAETPFYLMRAAYHLGNRHVPLELAADYLKLEPDPVLENMVLQLGGITLTSATLPFEPETGAYSGSPAPTHSHGHTHVHH